jgi:alkaline phosphatase D
MHRRAFLGRVAALGAGALLSATARALERPRFASDPFTLGVASGYPHPSGMTLWTRLAPRPLEGGGMEAPAVRVEWEIAHDESFRSVVKRGAASASADAAHSIHVDVDGLEPARWYWYRFRAGEAISPVGRTRTAPDANAMPERFRFALACCQQYEQGYYVAYRHMAREDLDAVVHVGDYIYESSWGRNHVRSHGAPEPYTLDQYRDRYALYRSDRDLQAAHAAFPWLVTWDDHEVDNDYANDRSQDDDPVEAFLARRAAAYRAYYEHMPLPAWAQPRGPDMQLYTSCSFGQLAAFSILDTRQYRSHQVCPRPRRAGGNVVRDENCPERASSEQSMLGARQEQWLDTQLERAQARWNVIAQQTLMAPADRLAGSGTAFWTDGWDGYPKARTRLVASIASHRVRNPLVLGGDVHMSVVTDLKADYANEGAPVVASELVCPSITSQGPSAKRVALLLQENPHIKFADAARHGYTAIELADARCTARIRSAASVTDPDASMRDLAVFVVEDGKPGAVRA